MSLFFFFLLFCYFVSNRIYSAAKIDNKSIANKKQPASFFKINKKDGLIDKKAFGIYLKFG